MHDIVRITGKEKHLQQCGALFSQLAKAKTPEAVRQIEAKLDAAETFMRESGLFHYDDIRPVNEARMTARWKLGGLLRRVERGKTGPKVGVMSSSLTQLLNQLGLTRQTANEAQRMSAMPEKELQKEFAAAHRDMRLNTFALIVRAARKWWFKQSREDKHKVIASEQVEFGPLLGTFPLIYADPPWSFQAFAESGKQRTADKHYPTLSLDEICNYKEAGKRVEELAANDAALFLWCTSSNMHLGLQVMDAWGFEFKSSAAWVKWKDGKLQTGMGLVFRNAHEVLLYGTRGKMPGPQYQPPSVFMYPRGRHSAKPEEIRADIERMFPAFADERTRLELFGRSKVKGWTVRGYESHNPSR